MSSIERSIRQIIRGDESDAELNKIVADLLAQEAREKDNGDGRLIQKEQGRLHQSQARKSLNTRFLDGIVRGIERHNNSLQTSFDNEAGVQTLGDDLSQSVKRQNKRRKESKHDQSNSSKSDRKKEDRKRRHHNLYSDEDQEKPPCLRSSSPVNAQSHSKMDKYFHAKYDPMLDVNSDVNVNKDDLIEDDGWERALNAIQDRKKVREERKLTRKMERERRRSSHSHTKGSREVDSNRAILKTQYTPTGSTCEWDKGKSVD